MTVLFHSKKDGENFTKNLYKYKFIEVGLCYNNVEIDIAKEKRVGSNLEYKDMPDSPYCYLVNSDDIVFNIKHDGTVTGTVIRCCGIECFQELARPRIVLADDTFMFKSQDIEIFG